LPIVEQIIKANIEYAKAHELLDIGPRPARRLIVLTCMDTRLSIRVLGLKPGDAHILRNAGGTVTEDVLRSIILSHHFFGTQSTIVINHTDCGMLRFNDRELREALRQKHGADAAVPAEFHSFTDIERNLREQMQKIRSHPWIPTKMRIAGFVYDVKTGLLRRVANRRGSSKH